MILDKLNMFADAQALPTAGTGTYNVGDQLDLGDVRDIGRGRPPLYLVIEVLQAVTSGGSATVQFELVSDSQTPPRTDGTSDNIHYQSAAIPVATLVAGYQIVIPLPWESPAYARYLGVQAVIGTAALTAGVISAGFTMDPSGFKGYPSAVYA